MKYNKNSLIDNIYSIAKKKDIKIGDLEEQSGVSKGYLSRVKSGSSTPTIETLCNISEVLGVSIDYLLKTEQTLTNNEKFIIDFIDKIIEQTIEDTMLWISDNCNILIQDSDERFDVNHPLINPIQKYTPEIDCWYYSSEYKSHFADVPYELYNLSFHSELPNPGIELYLMSVSYKENHYDSTNQLELYFWDTVHKTLKPICSTYKVNKYVADRIRELYEIILSSYSNISIDTETKKIMKDIIELFEIEKNGDDLPF